VGMDSRAQREVSDFPKGNEQGDPKGGNWLLSNSLFVKMRK